MRFLVVYASSVVKQEPFHYGGRKELGSRIQRRFISYSLTFVHNAPASHGPVILPSALSPSRGCRRSELSFRE